MPYFEVAPANRKNAKRMRRVMTEAELKLWNELRAHRLMGLSFRRQMPISGYIVDFACPLHKLVVEVDGSQHGNAADREYDCSRTEQLQSLGWKVLRVWNDEVLNNIDNVCSGIIRTIGMEHFDAK
ncbi:MAG: endonuclease domain-containing protein [Rhizobiales bacterium]|nr:endonuclease domain-containing protein [Hyphomicrobiales bacterium]